MAQDKTLHIELGRTRPDYGNRTKTAQLTLETRKHYNGGLVSSARVDWVGLNSVSHAFSIGGPDNSGDFSKDLSRSERTVKATQKAIDTQHARVFTPEVINEMVTQAKEYYDRQDAARAEKAAAAAKRETVHA